MYCTKCGAENAENTWKCVGCGEMLHLPVPSPGATSQPVQIPNYLVQSILCTLLCCLPLGIPGIVFAAQVNSKIAAGDFPGAMDASRKARNFCWASFGVGLAAIMIWAIIAVITQITER